MHCPRWPSLLVTLVLAGGLGGNAAAVEPVSQFLDALRQRHLYDEAVDYLDILRTSALVEESFRAQVPYEQGMIVLGRAGTLADRAARDSQLAKAAELLNQFLKSTPEHPLAGSAMIELANVAVRRGRAEAETGGGASRDESALAAARKHFDEGRKQLDEAGRKLEARLAELPKLVDAADTATVGRKRQMTSDLAQVALLRPSIDYELAATHKPGSKEAKKHLQEAAKGYARLAEEYRTKAAGLLARHWEGRCYQQLGQTRQALGCFRELMDQPPSDATREIISISTRHGMECLIAEGEKKYEEAIERGEQWSAAFPSRGEPDADALAIRYLTALAYEAQSRTLSDKDPNRQKLAGQARQYVGPVAKHPGEYQRPAKMLLVALGGSKEAPKGENAETTFTEAFRQAEDALAKLKEADDALLASRGKADDAAKKALRKKKDDSAALARRWLKLALAANDGKSNVDELNSVRYYLCYLAWDAGQWYDAAALGEFLLSHYPDTARGRQGARIALEAYIRLAGESKDSDGKFEAAHIARIGEEFFKRWPGEEETDRAALLLISHAAGNDQWDRALEYLKRISTNSPLRAQAELWTGQALWRSYVRQSRLPGEERPKQDQLDALRKRAQDVLGEAIARLEKAGKIDATLATAVFDMAQIYVLAGEPDKAVALLENPKMGPLTLIKAGSPSAGERDFKFETYKLALRAYIAVHPQQLDKAEQMMDALEKLVGGATDPKAAEKLTAIYISLGRELEQQLQELRKSGKTSELDSVTRSFEVFLDRVTKRDVGNSYASLNWVGETYFSLGGGFDEGTGQLSPKAKAYFAKATTAYARLLELAEKDEKYKDRPEDLFGFRLRLADCHKRSGSHDKAMAVLVDVLKAKPMLLPAQVQAAETYQAKGAVDPKGYFLAIQGGSPGRDGKNIVWGWARLSKLTMNDEKFKDIFHLSRLQMAEARYRFGLTEPDAAKRGKIIEAAKQDLWFTYKLRQDLGGQEIAARYDRLLKQIQKGLGGAETGLQEFREREAAASGAAKAATAAN